MSPPKKIFVIYAHEDESYRVDLATGLRPLERDGLVEVWHDRKLLGGDEWGGKIDEHLEDADLVLLLVSADFLASDYVHDVELRRALERHDSGDARVVPIIVRSCDWRSAPFAKLQALPAKGMPVKNWSDPDEAWTDVIKGLRRIVRGLDPLTETSGWPTKRETPRDEVVAAERNQGNLMELGRNWRHLSTADQDRFGGIVLRMVSGSYPTMFRERFDRLPEERRRACFERLWEMMPSLDAPENFPRAWKELVPAAKRKLINAALSFAEQTRP